MAGLPQTLRKAVEHRLRMPGFNSYKSLAQWIREQGHEISISSLRRFGLHLAREPAPTRSVKAQKPSTSEGSPGGPGVTTEGLMVLAQEKLRSALAEIDQLKRGDTSRLAHAVAHLTQAAISLQRWTDELDQRASERERANPGGKSKVRRGLSPETSEALRNALLGIAPFDPEQVASQKTESGEDGSSPPAAPIADECDKGQETSGTAPAAPFKRDRGFDNDAE